MLEVDIPYKYSDKNVSMKKVMKIKLLKRYEQDKFTYEKLNEYGIKGGEDLEVLQIVCMTSDFFLEEADEWRKEAWKMIRSRPDVTFWLQTKRAERVFNNLPDWWGEGLENVIMVFTTENQKRADERLPILLDLPFKHKGIMCAPMISEITLDKYLKTGNFEIVLVDGENYDGNRPLYFDWVKRLYDECVKYNIKFDFCGTGNVFIKEGKTYNIPKAYQRVMALKSELQNPLIYRESDIIISTQFTKKIKEIIFKMVF